MRGFSIGDDMAFAMLFAKLVGAVFIPYMITRGAASKQF